MSLDLAQLARGVAEHSAIIRVLISDTAGSVPRTKGTSMLVWETGQSGTIGGGALEHQATGDARQMLDQNIDIIQRSQPLGPSLGQCCGGSVTLIWERFTTQNLPQALPFARAITGPKSIPAQVTRKVENMRAGDDLITQDGWLIETSAPIKRPLWIYGAGHIGRALITVLAPTNTFEITWIDADLARFPDAITNNVTPLPAADMAHAASLAPDHAEHLIMTYSHEIDLALCHTILSQKFASAGLIGSATKWARFRNRLAALGHAHAQISRITCPIGDPTLGKHPSAIALGVGAGILRMTESLSNQGEMAG